MCPCGGPSAPRGYRSQAHRGRPTGRDQGGRSWDMSMRWGEERQSATQRTKRMRGETHESRCPGSQLSLKSFSFLLSSECSAAAGPDPSASVWLGNVPRSHVEYLRAHTQRERRVQKVQNNARIWPSAVRRCEVPWSSKVAHRPRAGPLVNRQRIIKVCCTAHSRSPESGNSAREGRWRPRCTRA
jgi:hypothetical protein